MKVGLNLFSIRNLIKTEEDFLDTALKLRDMGYTCMQYSGGEFDPGRIKRVSDASDLPVCLTHVPYDRIVGDTEKLMEEHDTFGCRSIGLGALNSKLLMDEDQFKAAVEELNLAGETMAKNGFTFCYHHHSFEFYRVNGVTAFDYMLENAPYINFTVDTYWLQHGGVDVIKTMERIGDRMEYLHMKDYKIAAKLKEDGSSYRFVPDFAPVGEGNINFNAVVKTASAYNVREFLVEQDNAADMPDTLDEVRRSIEYIRKEL